MPPDKIQHIIRQGGGHIYAPGPQSVGYTLQEKEAKESDERRDDEQATRHDVACRERRDMFGSSVITFSVNRDG